MRDGNPDGRASGFVCPTCGGALWEQPGDGHPSGHGLSFECRIGHRFEAAQLWIEHSDARNRALQYAARALAENAALARRLVAWAREQGDVPLAERLEQEATEEERLYQQVRSMTDGLPDPAPDVRA